MDFRIDRATGEQLEAARAWGQAEVRPVGLEADRLGRPIPVDHPYFQKMIARGEGRTRWRPKVSEGTGDDKPASARLKRSTVTSLLLAEEFAYWDRGVGVANPGPGLPEGNVLSAGNEEQKRRFLGPFLAPDKPRWACFAMTEPGAGSDAAAIATRARRDGNEWVLDGAKCFIGNASRAAWLLIQATTDPGKGRAGQRAFFVEQGTPGLGGFKIEKKSGLKAYESTSFTLDSCRVPAENLLGGDQRQRSGGDRRQGFRAAMATFNAGRPVIAANSVGIGRAVLDESLAFAREHGLLSRTRVRDRLEHMQRRLRAARLLCLKAGWQADQQRDNIVEASLSKAMAAQVGQEAATFGMELLGTVGARGDHLIEKLYRDVKAMDIVEGTGQIQRMIVARRLVGLPR
ncbi:MAG: acyl-CoA dehydrogenase family protein [Myxococcales bacterium]|nr:acyl-CoA dehydrogenase family protein [Myxococcales bacterium]